MTDFVELEIKINKNAVAIWKIPKKFFENIEEKDIDCDHENYEEMETWFDYKCYKCNTCGKVW